jgi:hypothetical protein
MGLTSKAKKATKKLIAAKAQRAQKNQDRRIQQRKWTA